jgi:hypothetical protein
VVLIRASAASASAAAILPLLTNFSYEAVIPARPRAVAASDTSLSTTSYPAAADTWAMPEPISPAPITARVLVMPRSLLASS